MNKYLNIICREGNMLGLPPAIVPGDLGQSHPEAQQKTLLAFGDEGKSGRDATLFSKQYCYCRGSPIAS